MLNLDEGPTPQGPRKVLQIIDRLESMSALGHYVPEPHTPIYAPFALVIVLAHPVAFEQVARQANKLNTSMAFFPSRRESVAEHRTTYISHMPFFDNLASTTSEVEPLVTRYAYHSSKPWEHDISFSKRNSMISKGSIRNSMPMHHPTSTPALKFCQPVA